MDDALRTLELLWGKTPAPKRGPNQQSSVAEIVDAAIALADQHGVTGVTMRAVGKELGRTAMSLYTYVPGREVLLTLMHDRAHAEMPTRRRITDWRKAALLWCRDLKDLYVRHPWLLEASQARPGLGPHEQDVLETLLRILKDLPIEVRPTVTSALYSIVREAAKRRTEMESESAKGPEWWTQKAQALHSVAPDFAERYPQSTAVAHFQSTKGTQPWIKAAEEAFTGSITLLLAGLG